MIIAGVDEVGRGCLAGPVTAAAVILNNPVAGLQDSKKLSPKRRSELSKMIIQNCIYSLSNVQSEEIDEINNDGDETGVKLTVKTILTITQVK